MGYGSPAAGLAGAVASWYYTPVNNVRTALTQLEADHLAHEASMGEVKLLAVIGWNIRVHRQRRGMRQSELLAKIGAVTTPESARANGYKVEHGCSTLTTTRVCLIAARLNVEPWDLLRPPPANDLAAWKWINARVKQASESPVQALLDNPVIMKKVRHGLTRQMSAAEIAQALTEQGVEHPHGRVWSARQIQGVLDALRS